MCDFVLIENLRSLFRNSYPLFLLVYSVPIHETNLLTNGYATLTSSNMNLLLQPHDSTKFLNCLWKDANLFIDSHPLIPYTFAIEHKKYTNQ